MIKQAHFQVYKTLIWKDTCISMFTAALLTITQHMEANEMSINRWINKGDVVHTHNGMLCVLSHSVMFNSLWPCGLQPVRLLCPWNSPGKNTGVGCHFLLQGIFLTQGSNPDLLCLLHGEVDSLTVWHLGSPVGCYSAIKKNETMSFQQHAWIENTIIS